MRLNHFYLSNKIFISIENKYKFIPLLKLCVICTFFRLTKYFHDLWLTGCQNCGPDVWSDLAHVVKGVSH